MGDFRKDFQEINPVNLLKMGTKSRLDAGLYKEQPPDENMNQDRTLFEHNTTQIRNIHIDDLNYLERDLDFMEKVSLMFLLCGGSEKERIKFVLQQLYVATNDPASQTTTFISDWARYEEKISMEWRDRLIESLAIIQANLCLINIGLNLDDLTARFSPQFPELTVKIHPIIKILYHICESLIPSEVEVIVKEVRDENPSAKELTFNDPRYLEIFLLHWLSIGLIDAGEWTFDNKPNPYRQEHCHVDPVIRTLKLVDKINLREMLTNGKNRFNCTQTNMITVEPDPVKCKIDEDVGRLTDDFAKTSLPFDLKARYPIRKETAGYLLIINQYNFHVDPLSDRLHLLPKKPLEQRTGTEQDKDVLEKTFSQFGYRVKVKQDLTDTEIFTAVKELVELGCNGDSIVLSILSHGCDGHVYGSNSMPVKIKDIEKQFATERLLNKPKILIIQACQGDLTQLAVPIAKSYLQTDGDDGGEASAPLFSDLLVAKSTVQGFTSIRHILDGSWFIQTLCEKILKFHESTDITDILRIVCMEVSTKRGENNQCMVPKYESTLRKQFYFPKIT